MGSRSYKNSYRELRHHFIRFRILVNTCEFFFFRGLLYIYGSHGEAPSDGRGGGVTVAPILVTDELGVLLLGCAAASRWRP